jgi:hypothetical protein
MLGRRGGLIYIALGSDVGYKSWSYFIALGSDAGKNM